jgi:hypothetical protein
MNMSLAVRRWSLAKPSMPSPNLVFNEIRQP